MTRLTSEMSSFQRVQVIEEALAVVLNRDETMSVESSGPSCCDRAVFVLDHSGPDFRVMHDLHQIARELEGLLS